MARSFNGSGDLIDLTFGSGETEATISPAAWIKTSAATGAILCSDSGASGGRVLQFKVNSTKMQYVLGNSSGTGAHVVSGSTVVNDGKWHHVAGTYDGTTMRIYVDGVLDGTLAAAASGSLASRPARIGAQIGGVSQQYFLGDIAEVSLFLATTPGAGAILSLAHGLPASPLGPNHYWPLWGTDSPEPDIGNG